MSAPVVDGYETRYQNGSFFETGHAKESPVSWVLQKKTDTSLWIVFLEAPPSESFKKDDTVYYRKVGDQTPTKLFIYNVDGPSRYSCNMQ